MGTFDQNVFKVSAAESQKRILKEFFHFFLRDLHQFRCEIGFKGRQFRKKGIDFAETGPGGIDAGGLIQNQMSVNVDFFHHPVEFKRCFNSLFEDCRRVTEMTFE